MDTNINYDISRYRNDSIINGTGSEICPKYSGPLMKPLIVEQRYVISLLKEQNTMQKEIRIAIGKDRYAIKRALKRNYDQRIANVLTSCREKP